MNRIIHKITPVVPKAPKLLKVAAYARVSMEKETMLHSFSAQVSYYSEKIQKHPGWSYAGVYADRALTGHEIRKAGIPASFGRLPGREDRSGTDEKHQPFCPQYGHAAGNRARAEGAGDRRFL